MNAGNPPKLSSKTNVLATERDIHINGPRISGNQPFHAPPSSVAQVHLLHARDQDNYDRDPVDRSANFLRQPGTDALEIIIDL